jgi:hypothetical protein
VKIFAETIQTGRISSKKSALNTNLRKFRVSSNINITIGKFVPWIPEAREKLFRLTQYVCIANYCHNLSSLDHLAGV